MIHEIITFTLGVIITVVCILKKPDRGHKLTDLYIKRIDETDGAILILIGVFILSCLIYQIK